jgi:lipoprotein-anchoring transpeptidase ErfK/SrfK
MAAWQVLLERRHYSGGTIDGRWGHRSQKSLSILQNQMGLKPTGQLDQATRERLGDPMKPFTSYTITSADMNQVSPPAKSWKDRSQQQMLGFYNVPEMLSEKFLTTPEFIRFLNPQISSYGAGTTLTVPNIQLSAPLPKATVIKISLAKRQIVAYDAQGKALLSFPCSIAKDKDKRPSGELKVVTVIHRPNYTFNPDVLREAAKKENISSKMIIPPGPNNPVGNIWIGLSLPGYGIHGTPSPEEVSRTGSHGCFRLANWNAEKLAKVVSIGTRVIVE